MNDIIVVFSSITVATRAKRLLDGTQYKGYIIQAPKELTKNGCSHAVRIQDAGLRTFLALCAEYDVKVRGVFKEVIMNGERKYIHYT